MSEQPLLRVERVGARGDGIANWQGRPVYLPLTAPGDLVRVGWEATRGAGQAAKVLEFVEPGARQSPPCPHFGSCGGCALQHLSDVAYAEAKETFVREALSHRGLDPDVVEPLRRLPAAIRRRATMVLERPRAGEPRVGFHARSAHRVIDLQTCSVLHPAIMRLVPPIRGMATQLLRSGEAASAGITLSERGIDLMLELPREPDYPTLERLAAFAESQDLARLGWRSTAKSSPSPIAQRRVPAVTFAGVSVDLPPLCFLQASAEADRLLAALVLDGIAGAEHVADLYSGVGTLTFPFAQHGASTHSVDASRAAIAALGAAARRAGLEGAITTEVRDLAERPLDATDLRRFAAVVFDPPRAGAREQAAALARSRVPTVVAVSCDPGTFSRDARILVDGGYHVLRVTPVDQFVWSPHVELVAQFRRR